MTGDEDDVSVFCRSNPASTSSINTPSRAHRGLRYKTELCRQFEEHGICCYGPRCQFAHGRVELRSVTRHPKYKTDLCRTFHTTGLCPYGPRCHFIHNDDDRLNSTDRLEPLRGPLPLSMNGVEFEVEQHLLGLILLAFNPAVTISPGRQHQMPHLPGSDFRPSTTFSGKAHADGSSSLSKSTCSSVARSASFGDIVNWTSV